MFGKLTNGGRSWSGDWEWDGDGINFYSVHSKARRTPKPICVLIRGIFGNSSFWASRSRDFVIILEFIYLTCVLQE